MLATNLPWDFCSKSHISGWWIRNDFTTQGLSSDEDHIYVEIHTECLKDKTKCCIPSFGKGIRKGDFLEPKVSNLYPEDWSTFGQAEEGLALHPFHNDTQHCLSLRYPCDLDHNTAVTKLRLLNNIRCGSAWPCTQHGMESTALAKAKMAHTC